MVEVTYTSDGVADHGGHVVDEAGSTGLVVDQGAQVCSIELLELLALFVDSTGLDDVVDHGVQVCSTELLELVVGSADCEELLVVDHGAHVCSPELLALLVGSTGLDEVVDHGAHVCSSELLLMELVGFTACEEALVLDHGPHAWLALEVVASTVELDEPVVELPWPECVIVVVSVAEVVSETVLLP